MYIGRPRNSSEKASAIRQLLSGPDRPASLEEVSHVLSLSSNGELDLSGLVGAWDGSNAVAAGLFFITSDGIAHLWPVEVGKDHPDRDEIGAAVTQTLIELIDRVGCPFAQSLAECNRLDQKLALERSGFRYLAKLNLLECSLSLIGAGAEEIAIPAIRITEETSARFAATIEQTYIGSRDCPGFMGIRTAADALESYKAAGEFSPENWWLVENKGRDIATILVNNCHDGSSREIVYLGVVPEARRSGIARRLLLAALRTAAIDGYRSVIVSVDAENAPAMQLYQQCHFIPKARHAVFIRPFGGPGTG